MFFNSIQGYFRSLYLFVIPYFFSKLARQNSFMLQLLKKKILFILSLLIIIVVSSCSNQNEAINEDKKSEFDLDHILKRGKLIVLTENSSASYMIYRGKKMGFEYELLREFADDLGVELEIKIINNLDKIPELLSKHEGDIVACNYTYTKDRAKEVAFSEPYLKTPQVLIQRNQGAESINNTPLTPTELIKTPEQLAKKTVNVWKNSSYFYRLLNLQEEIADTIFLQYVDGLIGSEELIEMVATGMIDYTVTDQNVAKANAKFYDNINIQTVLSVKQKICFGLRKDCPMLKARIDKWLASFMKKASFRYLQNKYFDLGISASLNISKHLINKKGVLSAYDAMFKRAAKKHQYDWVLLASQSYQESQFDPNVVGYGGAYGMMQFMPNVGPKYDVFPGSPPEVQIKGGMTLMAKYMKYWSKIKDKEQRIKFSLASYNAGLGHVLDAIALAEKHHKDIHRWDDNVAEMMLNLSKQSYYRDPVVKNGAHRGMITYNYVKKIYNRYIEWKAVYK